MSELLDRIEKEIRERLAATRAAMLEHERLQAALNALTGAGEEAAKAVRERAGGARRRTPRSAPVADDAAGAPQVKAAPKAPARASATNVDAAPKAPARKAAAGRPARARAPRGANREAVLRVVGERPGVSATEISAASGVQRNTLSSLLRTLVDRGELERRPLPGGRTGYALAAPKEETAAMSEAPAAATGAPAAEAAAAPTAGGTTEPQDTATPTAGGTTEPPDPAAPTAADGDGAAAPPAVKSEGG